MTNLTDKVAKAICNCAARHIIDRNEVGTCDDCRNAACTAIKILVNDMLENGPKGPLTSKERFQFNELIIKYAKENEIDIF